MTGWSTSWGSAVRTLRNCEQRWTSRGCIMPGPCTSRTLHRFGDSRCCRAEIVRVDAGQVVGEHANDANHGQRAASCLTFLAPAEHVATVVTGSRSGRRQRFGEIAQKAHEKKIEKESELSLTMDAKTLLVQMESTRAFAAHLKVSPGEHLSYCGNVLPGDERTMIQEREEALQLLSLAISGDELTRQAVLELGHKPSALEQIFVMATRKDFDTSTGCICLHESRSAYQTDGAADV